MTFPNSDCGSRSEDRPAKDGASTSLLGALSDETRKEFVEQMSRQGVITPMIRSRRNLLVASVGEGEALELGGLTIRLVAGRILVETDHAHVTISRPALLGGARLRTAVVYDGERIVPDVAKRPNPPLVSIGQTLSEHQLRRLGF